MPGYIFFDVDSLSIIVAGASSESRTGIPEHAMDLSSTGGYGDVDSIENYRIESDEQNLK